MEQELLFQGYSYFQGKKDPTQTYYKLVFVGKPKFSQDKMKCYRDTIDVFVNKDQYVDYIKTHDIDSKYLVSFEVDGTNVRYFI